MNKVQPSLNSADMDIISTLIDEHLEEKIKFLPTKDEFYSKMDEVMGELKAIREEQELITYKVSDHEDRLEVIETKLDIAT